MAIFDKFKSGLQKTRDFFSQNFTKLAGNLGRFDEDMLEELSMLMIQADVSVASTEFIINQVKDHIKATGDDQVETVIEVIRKAMAESLGPSQHLEIDPQVLNVLLMVGVNGTGKTTTTGKLAWAYRQQGYKVVMAAADTFRAAAIDQLEVWADRAEASLIKGEQGSDPASVVFNAIQAAKSRSAQILIVDTAGRLHNKKNLMDELAKIRRIIAREAGEAKVTSLLVIDATTGQNALFQAQAFNEVTDLDGLVITKLDGNAKGGIALTVAREAQLPIYFAGLGEQIDDLQEFDRDSYINSLIPEDFNKAQD
ncbi:MAG: signal recognition particle-docking protein FtsY [Eubacteriales bacterium]|nr:signal recognition particle-docking protein FtsY [Clostridiales bacterium]MDY5836159.1 signal recognition particle-docking protein FtsY [Eubacteriales bacterium]